MIVSYTIVPEVTTFFHEKENQKNWLRRYRQRSFNFAHYCFTVLNGIAQKINTLRKFLQWLQICNCDTIIQTTGCEKP